MWADYCSSLCVSRCMTTAGLGTRLQWVWAGRFVSTVPEGHPDLFPAFPGLRQCRGQCQQQCTLWAHATRDKWHHRAHFHVDSSCGGILSVSSPSRSAPVMPTSHRSSETDLRTSTPTTGEETLMPTGMWQPQSKEEAPFNIQSSLWSPQQQSHTLTRG